MSKKQFFSVAVTTPPFRMNFASVFEPETNKFTQKQEYKVMAIWPEKYPKRIAEIAEMDEPDFTELLEATDSVLVDKFGLTEEQIREKYKKDPKKLAKFNLPLKNHEDKEKEDGTLPKGFEKGGFFASLNKNFINAKGEQTAPPGIYDHNVEPATDPTLVKNGFWAKATVRIYAYQHDTGTFGVKWELAGLQIIADDELLYSKPDVSKAFKPMSKAMEV